jgi:hypothetical protein
VRVLVGAVAFLMTCTGAVDFIALVNGNAPARAVRWDQEDTVVRWIVENTDPHSRFLSHEDVLSPVLLAGRKLYYGWPYYAWSAGYDTGFRESMQARIYSAPTGEELGRLLKSQRIDYVVVAPENIGSRRYRLNEAVLRGNLTLAFESREKNVRIYSAKPVAVAALAQAAPTGVSYATPVVSFVPGGTAGALAAFAMLTGAVAWLALRLTRRR